MKYFLVLFVFGILCRNTLARRLDNPLFYDRELQIPRTQQERNMMGWSMVAPNFYEPIRAENTPEGITILQRLEKLEKNCEKELKEQLVELTLKYDSLFWRFSAIEKHLEEEQRKTSPNQYMESLTKESKNPESAQGKSDDPESDDNEDESINKLFNENDDLWIKKESPESESSVRPESTQGNSDDPESDDDQGDNKSVDESGESDDEYVESEEESPEEFQKIGSKYYYIENNEENTWIEALGKCKERNAHLVSLQNAKEWRALKKALEADHSYWVDINDLADEDGYTSQTSGKLAPFLKWDDDEPNSAPGAEDCVELRGDHDYKMNDVSCQESKYYICEKNNEDDQDYT